MSAFIAFVVYGFVGLYSLGAGDRSRTWPIQLAWALLGIAFIVLAFACLIGDRLPT